MCFLLLKEFLQDFKFEFVANGVVLCGGRKTSPHTSSILQVKHSLCPLRSGYVLRNHILDQRFYLFQPLLILISV